MTAAVELDVGALIPDGIEAVEAERCWSLVGGKLMSLNGGGAPTEWAPGKPLIATCNSETAQMQRWNVVRRGMTTEQAQATTANRNQIASLRGSALWGAPQRIWYLPDPPKVALPDGYGLELETLPRHDAPHEDCTCGIYAATAVDNVPEGGNVYGKAKLWGKVIPGESGYRAQYAYPSEFRVPASLANDATLKAFRVPIIVDEKLSTSVSPRAGYLMNSANYAQQFSNSLRASPPKPRMHWMLKLAIALNFGSAAFNIATSSGLHL